MSTLPDHNRTPIPRSRPAVRCLRHHVWLAACDDCREAHADLLGTRLREGGNTGIPSSIRGPEPRPRVEPGTGPVPELPRAGG